LKIPALNKLSSLQLFQVFRFGAPFAVSVVLVRLISQQGIGIYESLGLIGGSFTFFWVTGTINTFIPYYHSVSEEKRPALIFNVYIILVSLSILCFGVLVALKPMLFPMGSSSALYELSPNGHLYIFYLIYNLFNAPAFLMEYLLLLKNRSKAIVLYGILISGMQILSLTVPLMLHYSLETSVLVLAISSILKFVVLTIYVGRTGIPQISVAMLKAFGNKALPAVLTLVVGGSMPYIDAYIALKFYNKAQFAIYTYGAREMPLVALMANALSNVFSGDIAAAHLAKNIHLSFKGLKASSVRLMHSLFPVTIVLIISSRFLFSHVYSPAFLASAGIFNAFMLLSISRLIFPQTVLMALMKNRTLLIFNSIEWIVNLVLDFVFLHYFGLIGIAYATVIAYFLEKVIEIIYLSHIGYKPSDYIPLKTWSFYAIVTIFVWVGSVWLG
jgi:O-antigen/teichoic acid export membrane protein